jgi:hypothetical protein
MSSRAHPWTETDSVVVGEGRGFGWRDHARGLLSEVGESANSSTPTGPGLLRVRGLGRFLRFLEATDPERAHLEIVDLQCAHM